MRVSEDADTTGFSRVVLQLEPTANKFMTADTTDFSRVEFQFLPKRASFKSPKLSLHSTEVGGI
jgi:hypothetical protein